MKIGLKPSKGPKKTISTTEFIIAALVFLFLETFLLYNFVVGPRMEASAKSRMDLAERRAVLDNYRYIKTSEDVLYDQLEEVKAQVDLAEIRIPPVLYNEDISAMIGRISGEHNVSIESVSFLERRLIDPAEYIASAGGGLSAGGYATERLHDKNVPMGAAMQNEDMNPLNGGDSASAYRDTITSAGGDGLSGTAGGDIPPDADGGAATELNLPNALVPMSALYDDAPISEKTLGVQGVQINFTSEFHTARPFIQAFENDERLVRIKSVSIARIQEGELKGVLNLEFVSLLSLPGQQYPGLPVEGPPYAAGKDSLFGKYGGFIEDNADPTILLLSDEDDVDPDFYLVLKASSSNETKVSYGIYPRVETELRSNVNNAVRAKLAINGDGEQFEYVWSLASYQKSEKRKLAAVNGKLRIKVLSCQRIGDDDNVAILFDIDNNTDLPFEITVVNDDVLTPRFHLGMTKGIVNVIEK
jgi:hypothetical protein